MHEYKALNPMKTASMCAFHVQYQRVQEVNTDGTINNPGGSNKSTKGK